MQRKRLCSLSCKECPEYEQTEKKAKVRGKKKDYYKEKGAEDRDRYAEAYTVLMSFDDKRRTIEAQYQRDRSELEKIGNAQIRETKLQEGIIVETKIYT